MATMERQQVPIPSAQTAGFQRGGYAEAESYPAMTRGSAEPSGGTAEQGGEEARGGEKKGVIAKTKEKTGELAHQFRERAKGAQEAGKHALEKAKEKIPGMHGGKHENAQREETVSGTPQSAGVLARVEYLERQLDGVPSGSTPTSRGGAFESPQMGSPRPTSEVLGEVREKGTMLDRVTTLEKRIEELQHSGVLYTGVVSTPVSAPPPATEEAASTVKEPPPAPSDVQAAPAEEGPRKEGIEEAPKEEKGGKKKKRYRRKRPECSVM